MNIGINIFFLTTVDCIWGEFVFGECDAPCGEGIQIGKRPILQPALYGGKPCEGSDTTTKKCNSDPDAGENGYFTSLKSL